jgi:putative phosphonate metabolism protein
VREIHIDHLEAWTRYAIYFVPAAESALYRFGSSILGYDCYCASDVPLPDEFAQDAGLWRELTQEPRRYGFHATLKAPFHLSPSCTEAQLTCAFLSFAALGHAVGRIEPEVDLIGDFTAVVPKQPSDAVAALADECTTMFDAFRAPASARERARRVAANLSQSQMHNLERWGYPYLFRDFRFHMTLTGKLARERAKAVPAQLRASFGRACGEQDLAVDRLALLKQEGEHGRFRVICQAGLAASR